jgi:hypothetical protein
MNDKSPSLIEPGVKYFLKETLKQCQKKKITYYYYWWNTILFVLFLFILGSLLVWKKQTKPTKDELTAKREQQRLYILEKIKTMQEKKKKETNEIITNLPKFESDFEIMHKNYYKV